MPRRPLHSLTWRNAARYASPHAGYRGVALQPCYRKHRDGGSMSDLRGDVFAISPDIRYVAVADGQQVHMRSRPDLRNASSSDSDLYEELLVNPTLLTLATQRGNIACGGLRYLIIGYGHFHQLVVPSAGGSAPQSTRAAPALATARLRVPR